MEVRACDYSNRLNGTERSFWIKFAKWCADPGVLNLGLGFPDLRPPERLLTALENVTTSDNAFLHQYTRSFGHPRLVNALSHMFSPLLERKLNPMTEILVSIGASGALFCIMQGLVNPGDEVIIIESAFDVYEPQVRIAEGVPLFCPLRPSKTGIMSSSGDWTLDPTELESKFSNKTKLIIINTPNNPLGKVYTRVELEMIADLCKKYDVICVADEVYEWIIYPGHEHFRIATLPGMWERTLTVGSAGKTFSVTGWKLGWSIGPENLLFGPKLLHQNSVYTCPTPIQEALAEMLEFEQVHKESPDCYLHSLAHFLLPKRDQLAQVLENLDMHPVVPEGGYFLLADISQMKFDISDDDGDGQDFTFVKWMITEKKLAAVPLSVFYCDEHKSMGENYIRFCFIKEDSTLLKVYEILHKWKAETK